jgi:flagellar hook-associated protein 3
MRISNNMMIYNFLGSLNKSLNRMNTIQEQLSDGKIVHRPSDDPIRAFRGLRFNVALTSNEQYTQNSKDATEWLNQTDSALADLSEITQSAKETAIQAVSSNPSVALSALAEKIDGLIDQAVTVANTQLGDRYIFAGQQDKMTEPPYERTTLTINGVASDVVIYKGDLNKISLPIQAGAADPSRDSINVTGEDVFGPLQTVTADNGTVYKVAGAFSDLIQLKQQITGSSMAQSNTSGGAATVGNNYYGTGNQAFKVKIDSVAAGQVMTASYSTDNGLTWKTATPDNVASPTSFTLSDGATIGIATAAANTVGDTYTFQDKPNWTMAKSNATSGTPAVSGTYTGTGTAAYKVRIDTVAAGVVTGASYSTDGGTTWTPAAVAGNPGVVTLSAGLSLTIGNAAGNTAGDSYTFKAEPAGGLATNLQWISDTALANVDKGHDRMLLAQTQIGARMSSYEMAQNMMERDNITISENQSANDDIDIAKLTIDFKNVQNVYQAALSVGAQIMPASLVDFLK